MRVTAVPWAGIRPSQSTSPLNTDGDAPLCVVDETSFDFGAMGIHRTATHVFVLHNAGSAPLRLTEGKTSCSCALSKIEQDVVAPGQSTEVTIEWKTKDSPQEYQQTATIQTNDPDHPLISLTVTGRVTVAVRAVPTEVNFGSIAIGETHTRQMRLYGYLEKPLDILGWTLSDPTNEKYFDLTLEPLSSQQLTDEPGAKSGVLATITVKSGLPQGAFLQTITLKTNQETASQVEVPVHGTITSDIGIVGKGWDSDKGLLIIGVVDASVGAQRRLMLIARGPYRKDVRFSLEETVPGELKAVVGEPTPIGDGAVIQTPLLVEIPRGAHSVNCLGSSQGDYGRIRLKTNHPLVPEIELLVYFSVEGD